MRLCSAEDRGTVPQCIQRSRCDDQQFHSLSPTAGGYITGNYHSLSLSLCLCTLSTHCTPLYGQGDTRTGTRTESFKVLSAWMHLNSQTQKMTYFIIMALCYCLYVSLICPLCHIVVTLSRQ